MGGLRTHGGRAALLLALAAVALPAAALAGGAEQADLTLVNRDSPDPVATGAALTYTIDVTNAGPATATGLAMTDNTPGGTVVLSATPSAGTCNPNPHKVVCRLASLEPNASWSIAIDVVVNKKKGSLTNAAAVQSDLPDPRPGDNSQSQTTAIAPPPDPPNCEGVDGTIVGTDGDDVLTGTDGPDVIVGLGGADVISGLGGDDRVCGGSGNDDISGMGGQDLLRAKSGEDVVRGGDGSDDVGGGPGRDRLYGGLRPDLLRGGPGHDRCFGGFGRDRATSC